MRDQELHSISTRDANSRILLPTAEEGVGVGDLLRRLAAHAWFIGACGALGFVLSLGYIKFRPTVYEASALLRIDPARADSLAMTDHPAPIESEPGETIHTEIVILKSEDVAIRTLNSLTDEEFVSFTGLHRSANPIPQDAQNLSGQQQLWVAKLEGALTVKQIDGTQLVALAVKYKDPKVAAALANDLIKAYTVQTFEDRAHSVAELRGWLSTQMDELKKHVEISQAKLTDYERVNDVVVTPGSSNTIADRLHFLGERLSFAQSDRIMKEAQLRAARRGSAAELSALFPNPRLTTLEAAQGTLLAQYAQLSTKFGPKYPPLADLKKQMDGVDEEIGKEVQSVVERLNTDYSAAKRAEDMLQDEYDKQIALAYQFNRNQAEYSVLQGDVATSKDLYDALQRKLQQATVDTEVAGLNTVVVQGAHVPLKPEGPRSVTFLLASLVLGSFGGVIAAVISDGASERVHGRKQVERELGFPVLALIGGVFRTIDGNHCRHAGSRRSPLVLGAPLSQAAEEIRALRNSIILAPATKSLMVASAKDGEGALQVATNLAVLLANSGSRTVLVDIDLQKSRVPAEFGADNGPGLGEYLAGGSAEPEPMRPVADLQNLFMVTAGNAALETCDRLASATFHSLLLKWRSDFDYVVVIGAPLLVENVGMVVASWVDGTVLLAQDGRSRSSDLKQVRDALLRNNAKIHGLVISDLPRRMVNEGNATHRKETRYEYPKLAKVHTSD